MLDYYDDIISTIEDYSKKEEQPKFKMVKYLKRFEQHVPIEVVAMHDEDSKYCVIHALLREGEVVAIKQRWRMPWPKRRR